jgi:hypothetical protein
MKTPEMRSTAPASIELTVCTRYAAETLRTQDFTIGAGLRVTASAPGAALAGLVAGLRVWLQLLLVASSTILAGVLDTVLLALGLGQQQVADHVNGDLGDAVVAPAPVAGERQVGERPDDCQQQVGGLLNTEPGSQKVAIGE